MKRWKEPLLHLSLVNKLILAFSVFVVVPLLLIGGVLSWVYVENNRDTMLGAAVETNKQILSNIDTSIQPLLRLSMLPIQEPTVYQIMQKDYNKLQYPLLERGRDYDKVNNLIRNGIMLYSETIDSVTIFQANNHLVFGRSSSEYINSDYAQQQFLQEGFVQEIQAMDGQYVAVGIHNDYLLSRQGVPVVSIGRAIMDPYSKQNLGFILLNISVDKLRTFWNDSALTENTSFYLIDEKGRIIYGQQHEQIGQMASTVLDKDFLDKSASHQSQTYWGNSDQYILSSLSPLTGWTAVTVIPKRELFSVAYQMAIVLAVSLIVLLILSVMIATRVSHTIMKPLAVLKRKMKLVSQGKLDVQFEPQYGEIGIISNTVDNMLRNIRELIERIYREENEKRELEMLALQSQIQPHFIYNTLNVIKWMAKIQGAAGIEEALGAFTSVIKFTAKAQGTYTAIGEELEFIQNYTKILDYRYMGKFEVDYSVDPSLVHYRTLKFLLQPLVENAVFHGFDGIAYKGQLKIEMYKDRDGIMMEVTDNGKGLAYDNQEEQHKGVRDPLNSIGIQNVRERIALHFGQGYGLWLVDASTGGTTAIIRIPVIEDEGKDELK
ncbi:sensor histidine kinase [Paenibacillus sp. GCM10012307]|uniref:Sensor histidine kinase n=1 Tax=Paenibacillus roseus TaxID=2798579 RepID=A0A934J8T7_9BACL|nr:sensor histidine kinase [Paenibacillus roseus]MBJ6362542.1 sensor histidine kinase [Paenibacillus roseus]